MKVVLFCGGQGLRLRDYNEHIPKPMVTIGYRPILWHLMKYYAHYGHKDFILCLGHKADAIKDYFLNYNECLTNDFVLGDGGRQLKLLNSDIQNWTITFVDTGSQSNIGQRLMTVRDHIGDDEMFLANYADGLSDIPVPKLIENMNQHGAYASFLSVRPAQTFHVVDQSPDGYVKSLKNVNQTDLWVNGGFFAFRKEFWNYMKPGEELVIEPFNRLMQEKRLSTQRYEGFWACMDTFKEKMEFDDRYAKGEAPWEVWREQEAATPAKTIRIGPAAQSA